MRILGINYTSIFGNCGTVNVPPERYMPVDLLENWQDKIEFDSRTYPAGTLSRENIDEIFNQLHEEGKMEFSDRPSQFTSPVFVVWRTVDGVRKGRVVLDIRKLNSIVKKDKHPVPEQSEMLSFMLGCDRISTTDAISFFN